jgi:hypothetical protein
MPEIKEEEEEETKIIKKEVIPILAKQKNKIRL